ncbi:transcriptional regulator [Paenibacillus phage Harrison]|uniref:Transcriptional regulator n=3 Tax=root TaxID=1 RepID=A0A0K2CYV5_9CAUD|nr:transcriptional regulator [Paenibacillus phage Harrison]ALA12436.1 transcriptional regulator [Paenibacillus phage Harrison]ALA12597.1 transcriptional regulator [Paenibacillus phage Paisley]
MRVMIELISTMMAVSSKINSLSISLLFFLFFRTCLSPPYISYYKRISLNSQRKTLNYFTISVESLDWKRYTECEVRSMLLLKINQIMDEKRLNTRQLSKMTGIRWNTINDMSENKSKHWSPDNLNKIYKALGLKSVSELFEYVEDDEKATEA